MYYKPVLLLLLSVVAWKSTLFAQKTDYNQYHKNIADAEYRIFVLNDSIKGLKEFKNTFDDYDFVFVDDCIEAFQLALYFKQEAYAMSFIKKALENGFELKLLEQLNMGYTGDFRKVAIYKPFIEKNQKTLEAYAARHYPTYLKRIDKTLFEAILRRHVREQLFKNYHKGLTGLVGVTREQDMKEQNEIYKTISDNNLRFIDSLANEGVFWGEKNLGLYTDKLIDSLHLSFRSIEDLLHQVLRYYHLPENTYVPVDREREYFEIDPVYNILFHNSGSYSALSKYKDKAIKEGYLHPRAYESLKFNHHGFPESEQLYLWPSNKEIKDTSYMNTKRRQSFLSTYETDLKKHQFAHLHNLKLYFGFRGESK